VDGITIVDIDMVRASKRVIISTERIVSTDEIRKDPTKTIAPYWLVDAVCEVPYGSYPGNMPYEYYSDEEHLAEWLAAEKDPAAFAAFLDKYIYGVDTFEEYLQRAAGKDRLDYLCACEPLKRSGGEA
jgi:glutaconate CoA-transferase subunit A